MSIPPTLNFHSEELGKIAEAFARTRAKEPKETPVAQLRQHAPFDKSIVNAAVEQILSDTSAYSMSTFGCEITACAAPKNVDKGFFEQLLTSLTGDRKPEASQNIAKAPSGYKR